MTDERLKFTDPERRYHGYHAAQHVVRYGLLKAAVAGKRVLDVACGEGYGSYLMAQWGASEVVGVDISQEAVRNARAVFKHISLEFCVCDAENLDEFLSKQKPFDLIVGFEMIEHLRRPEAFLDSLQEASNAGAVITISCPNDVAYAQVREDENSFHEKVYTFPEFREMAEAHLGEASQWLLGSPVNGEMNFILGEEKFQDGHTDMRKIVDVMAIGETLVLPAQDALECTIENCSHYIGLWNFVSLGNSAICPINTHKFAEPWIVIEELRATERTQTQALIEADNLHQQLRSDVERERRVSNRATQLGQENVLLREQIMSLGDDLDLVKSELASKEKKLKKQQKLGKKTLKHLSHVTETLEEKMLILESLSEIELKNKNLAVALERERQKHKEASKRPLQVEVQQLKNRISVAVETQRFLQSNIDKAQSQINAEKTNIEKLNDVLKVYEDTKKNWWDPKIEELEQRIKAQTVELDKFKEFQRSHFFRIAQFYYKLHRLPVLGGAFRLVGRLLHLGSSNK